MPRLAAFLAAFAAVAGVAAADTRVAKPARLTAKLRAEVHAALTSGDAGRRCRAAIALGKAGDHVRAGLLVAACSDETLAADTALADTARKTRIAISKAATAGDWSKVELVIKTPGAVATVDAYPEIPLATGAWRLPPGTYTIASGASSSQLVLHDGIRSLVVLEPPAGTAVAPVRHKTVDFTSGEPMDAPVAGPPKVEHGSLLPERYRKAMAARRKPKPGS